MGEYLITGGAGFIGSHLADALLIAGQGVRILDDFSTGQRNRIDPRCEVVTGDVTDPATLRDALAGMDGCYHLAAIASVVRGNEDWLGTHRVNQTGTVAVLQAAREADGGPLPVVYASSAAVYGDLFGEGGGRAREDAAVLPRTAYGADKLGSELHARVAWQVHGVPTLGLRFFNVYGPRQDGASPYSGVVSLFARRLAAGLPLSVHGSGQQTRDFVYVADAVAHLRAAMRHAETAGGHGVLNVCTGTGTTVLALATTLARLLGRNPRIQPAPARPGDILHSVGDPTAAAAVLGLRAQTTLEDGLATMLASLQPAAA